MKKSMLSVFLAVFIVSGCANMTDRQQTIFQGAGLGVAAGAATGALIGQAIGHDTTSTLIGAGIGSVLGGLGGAVYGKHIADMKAQYASEEAWLRDCIAHAQIANQQAANYIAQLKVRNSKLEKEVKRLVAEYNKHKVSTATLRQKKKDIDNEIAQLNVNTQEVYRQIEEYKSARAKVQSSSAGTVAKLDRQISELEAAALELENQTTALASINQRIVL